MTKKDYIKFADMFRTLKAEAKDTLFIGGNLVKYLDEWVIPAFMKILQEDNERFDSTRFIEWVNK